MSDTVLPKAERTRLLRTRPWSLAVPLVVLLGTELLHIGATLANDGEPKAHHASFGPPLHGLGALATIAVLVWVLRGGTRSATLTSLTGAAVVLAAAAYHVVPFNVDYNNPFWHGATALQWVSVVGGVAAGAWCCVAGVQAKE